MPKQKYHKVAEAKRCGVRKPGFGVSTSVIGAICHREKGHDGEHEGWYCIVDVDGYTTWLDGTALYPD